MNIGEAIKLLHEAHNFRDTPYAQAFDDALSLGIEALKLYGHNRQIGQHVDPLRLPGETEEGK